MEESVARHPLVRTLIIALLVSGAGSANAASGMPADAARLLEAAALEQLVAPIALYPDGLLAIVLPASTYPLQIVQATRFLEAHKTNPSLKPDVAWDDTIVALLNYPETLALLNTDLDWTWRLGAAVLNQQPDVIKAVGHFRERALAAGNLVSDEHKIVSRDNGVIKITLRDSTVIHVPYYDPAQIIYPQSGSIYHYYPDSYPLYYYPYPAGTAFLSGPFWGVTTAFTIGWYTHRLHLHHHGYRSHPYYGHRYHRSHFYRYSFHLPRNHHRDYHGDYWHAGRRHGHRPRHHPVKHRTAVAETHRDIAPRSDAAALPRSQSKRGDPLTRSVLSRERATAGAVTIFNATPTSANLGAFARAIRVPAQRVEHRSDTRKRRRSKPVTINVPRTTARAAPRKLARRDSATVSMTAASLALAEQFRPSIGTRRTATRPRSAAPPTVTTITRNRLPSTRRRAAKSVTARLRKNDTAVVHVKSTLQSVATRHTTRRRAALSRPTRARKNPPVVASAKQRRQSIPDRRIETGARSAAKPARRERTATHSKRHTTRGWQRGRHSSGWRG